MQVVTFLVTRPFKTIGGIEYVQGLVVLAEKDSVLYNILREYKEYVKPVSVNTVEISL